MKNVAHHPIAAALRAQAQALNVAADALEAEQATIAAGGEYVNQNTAPIGKRRFLAAAGRGDFASFKTGKLVLAKRADFDAWLATSSRNIVRVAAATDAPVLSDADSLRSKLGLRVVGGDR